MLLTLDNLGKRYGMLPSQIIKQANTFDLVVMDAAMTMEQERNRDKSTPPNIPESELVKIWENNRAN